MLHRNLREGGKNPGSTNKYICSVDYQENRENYCYHMSHFKAKIHQIRFPASVRSFVRSSLKRSLTLKYSTEYSRMS